MENAGWTFSDKSDNKVHIRLPNPTFCKDVPSTSYCGFISPGDLMLSYTFSYTGIAKLKYGHSWKSGCVLVKKNNVEIDSRCSRGVSTTTFAFSSGDVLQIIEAPFATGKGQSIMNIHSLELNTAGTRKSNIYETTNN